MITPSIAVQQSRIPFRFSHLAIAGVLSVFTVLSGLVPSTSQSWNGFKLDAAAQAQTSPAMVTQYARAAYEIEQLRQQYYAQAKKLLGGNVPGDVCRQSSLPQSVRAICTDFLSKSEEIIKNHNLTVAQFNDMTRRKKDDPALQQQIQSELLEIQKGIR
jgi:hypothetical protein